MPAEAPIRDIDGFYWINRRAFRIVATIKFLLSAKGEFVMADINSASNAAPTFEERLSFGTSASLGLPDLIGGASGVMGFAAPAPVVDGFLIKPEFDGTAPIKSYTTPTRANGSRCCRQIPPMSATPSSW